MITTPSANGRASHPAATELEAGVRLLTRGEPGAVVEVRALNHPRVKAVTAGYYDDFAKLAADVRGKLLRPCGSIYAPINRINPDLLARYSNRLQENAATTTSDHDILARRWLFFDVDPVRPKGIPSSDTEHEAALARAADVAAYLREEHGWPEPVRLDSGNGAYLLYAINLPNDDDAKRLVVGCLKAIDALFSDDQVKIDQTCSNAARICRLPGTVNRKGDGTEERRHRPCRVLSGPDPVEVVGTDLLGQVAASAAPDEEVPPRRRDGTTPPGRRSAFDLDDFLRRHGISVEQEKSWQGGRLLVLKECPFNPEEHNRGEAHVQQLPSGAVQFACKHDSCRDYGWADLRDKFEPGYRDRSAGGGWRGGSDYRGTPQVRHQPRDGGPPDRGREPHAPHDRFRFDPIDSATFFAVERKHTWLVERMLVKGEPVVIGGPRKSMKTSVLIDLGVSLATGTPFLGSFKVYRRQKVALLSGESGEVTIDQTARRVCAAKGVRPEDCGVHWQFTLPRLGDRVDVAELRDGIRRHGVEVVMIDPLYLCLLDGQQDVSASNMYQMGPLLLNVARACHAAGATPLLAHHANRQLKVGDPMELDDLAYAGIIEFTRQWLLLNRRSAFDKNAGRSELWLAAGGSAGQSGEWAVDIEEGLLDAGGGGRRWDVAVHTTAEAALAARSKAEQARTARKDRDQKQQDNRVLAVVEQLTESGAGPATKEKIRGLARLSGEKTTDSLVRLVAEGFVEEVEAVVTSGKNGKSARPVKGYRRRHAASDGLTGLTGQLRLYPVSPVSRASSPDRLVRSTGEMARSGQSAPPRRRLTCSTR